MFDFRGSRKLLLFEKIMKFCLSEKEEYYCFFWETIMLRCEELGSMEGRFLKKNDGAARVKRLFHLRSNNDWRDVVSAPRCGGSHILVFVIKNKKHSI